MTFLFAMAMLASPIIYKTNVADEKPIAVRPTQKTLLGFTIQQINDFRRAQNEALDMGTYCFIEGMRRDGLAMTDRQSQATLDDSYKNTTATFDMLSKNGIRLSVGIVERCAKRSDNDELWGSLLLATKDGKILWAEEYSVLPLFLFLRRVHL